MQTLNPVDLRRTYGFDEVSIVPGQVTVNPEQTDIGFELAGHSFGMPILAAAMDAVVSPDFAARFDDQGGLAVMNLEGIYSRYDDPLTVLEDIVSASDDSVTSVLQEAYKEEIRDELVHRRIREVKDRGARCGVSVTPANALRLGPVAAEAGADLLFVQSTVTSARHVSNGSGGLRLQDLLKQIETPIVVGNAVSYGAVLELMETGIHGILVGVGPGATCTTREVTGVGVPQVTATLDSAAARNEYYRRTGRYVPIITDGGIRTGGDLCKTLACGADAAMIGTPFAQSEEAPGKGFNWGMASPHPALPRGTRINVGTIGSLEQILRGPSSRSDGTVNLLGAVEVCLGMIGAFDIRDFHSKAEVVVAPAIKTEGKHFQLGLN